ncbi:MAG: ATP-binding protein [Gammaproteobacteria bacterium]|nr:MAG: ATP-binding protein [Gammaproteobacteria bacterium]
MLSDNIHNTTVFKINNELDVARAVLTSTSMTKKIGFTQGMQNVIATIVSELAKNILYHAKSGEITLAAIKNDKKRGIEICAKDRGPGIKDIGRAMEDHFSTRNTLGLGLPAVKRMADELSIDSKFGEGTIIVARKWLHGKS